MLPIELDSIKRGLAFAEKKYSDGKTYAGYLNADGQRDWCYYSYYRLKRFWRIPLRLIKWYM